MVTSGARPLTEVRREADARRVEGDVAAADDHYPVADRKWIAEVQGAQELHRLEAAVQVVTLHWGRRTRVQPRGEEHCLVSVCQQTFDGEVDPAALVEAQIDAQAQIRSISRCSTSGGMR